MIYLLLSISCSSLIYLIFKSFGKYEVPLFPAIVTNYLVAASFGFLQVDFSLLDSIPSSLLIASATISLLFISLFYLMAYVAEHMGVSVSSNASKMSMLIPLALLALFQPEEKMNFIQVMGLIIAFFGIYFTSLKKNGDGAKGILLPFLLFIGSGILDYVLAYANNNLLHGPQDDALFTSMGFGMAFIWGILILSFQMLNKGVRVKSKSILGGIILGVVNYGSIYFLLRTYASNIAQKTAILPINNMSIIVVSTLLSLFIFKEKLSGKNWLGLSLSLAAILLIFLSA